MLAGRTVTELMKSGEERVRLDAAKYYTARRMGWKESNVSEHVGKDGGPIENKDVTARELLSQVVSRYEGTRLGRQELSAEILDDIPGALWTRAVIDGRERLANCRRFIRACQACCRPWSFS